jgi:hypothetical protein
VMLLFDVLDLLVSRIYVEQLLRMFAADHLIIF